MAGINLPSIPRISDADLDDVKERRRIMNYLIKLDEQLRYMMTHLGEENFTQETVEAIRNGGASVESIRSLQTELGQATTKIEQNAQAITAKASQSSVDALGNRVTQAETTLTLKADQATLTTTANGLQSQIDAIPGVIDMKISQNVPDEVLNTSVHLDTNGIAMSGGEITMQAGTQFSVQSGGIINLEATGGGSTINLGGKFTVTEEGDVAAASGSFDSLAVNNQRVLTLSDIGIPIKVAANQPTGSNFIWVQPTGGGSVSSVRYTGYTAPSRNNDVNFGVNNTISRSFTSEDGVSTLSGSTYTYELEFEIYSLSSFTGVTFSATATKDGSTVTFAASSAITLNKYNHPVIKLTASSSVNLASSASAITVAITATASPGRDGLFLQSQQNMTLTISTTSSGSGVQTCNVKYVP